MRFRWVMVASLLAVASAWATAQAGAGGSPDGARWWSHVLFLADDRLEGRNTGSEGHRKAAEYVAEQFRKVGLEPAGTDGFFQEVKLVSRQIDEAHSSLTLVRDSGERMPMVLGEDAILSTRTPPAAHVSAGLAFAGYGLLIPEVHHDDFAGLDVRGKLVVILSGAPKAIPGPLAAHMQTISERAAALRKAGAIGVVSIMNPRSMDIPWARIALSRTMPSMGLADPAFDESAGVNLQVTINPARADMLFQGTGHSLAEILDAHQAGQPLPHFAIPARLDAVTAVKTAEVVSQNVVGVRRGSDPKLKNEYVAFSAHLDHLGVGAPIKGDGIYNGAMDNASGIAAMLDVAAMLHESGAKLRRSVLFVAVTAEEKGLLGSKYFARSPTVPAGSIVADINSDMFLPLFPLKMLTIYGLDESEMGPEAAAIAESMGIQPQRDQEPQRNIFIRSDQYSFIREGIPSLMFKVGCAKGSPEETIQHKWLTERYHAPSDDLAQPIDRSAAGTFDVLVARLLEKIANRDDRPRWNDSSFFKRFAK